MKPEIRELLPELPPISTRLLQLQSGEDLRLKFIEVTYFEAWLNKLTEGAEQVEGRMTSADGFIVDEQEGHPITHTALLICPREIKKQTPEEVMREALEKLSDWPTIADLQSKHSTGSLEQREDVIKWFTSKAREALAKIETEK